MDEYDTEAMAYANELEAAGDRVGAETLRGFVRHHARRWSADPHERAVQAAYDRAALAHERCVIYRDCDEWHTLRRSDLV